MIHLKTEIETHDDNFDVWLSGDFESVNGDIFILDITWNKTIYSDYANELIAKDLKDNYKYIENKLIEKHWDLCKLEP